MTVCSVVQLAEYRGETCVPMQIAIKCARVAAMFRRSVCGLPFSGPASLLKTPLYVLRQQAVGWDAELNIPTTAHNTMMLIPVGNNRPGMHVYGLLFVVFLLLVFSHHTDRV
eukprot:6196146-Pleurochrysis_carterae.AAC.2